jgi:ABC-type multidrug transport system permease subunit
VSVLKRVAQAGSTVLLTIHQPSSDIFSALDNLIQLERGEVLFGGRVQDVPQFFEQRGYPCPPHYNPADWILNVAQTSRMDDLKAKGFFLAPEDSCSTDQSDTNGDLRRRKSSMPKWKALATTNNHQIVETGAKEPHPGFLVQTKLLFLREVHNVHRNTKNLVARSAMSVVGSVLGGILFFQVGKNSFTEFINLQSTFGGLLMSLLANVFSTALPSLVAFPEERPVFLREYSTNHYSVSAYFASRLTMEALVTASQALISTILTYFLMGLSAGYGTFWSVCYVLAMTSTALGVLVGCSVKEPDVAIEFLPMIFMPQILFSGFFVPPDLIPVWLRWLQYIFPLTYAVKLVMVAEFDGACNGLEPNYCLGTFKTIFSRRQFSRVFCLTPLVCFFHAHRTASNIGQCQGQSGRYMVVLDHSLLPVRPFPSRGTVRAAPKGVALLLMQKNGRFLVLVPYVCRVAPFVLHNLTVSVNWRISLPINVNQPSGTYR